MEALAAASPPDPPELPEGAAPRWPPWYAGVGFLVALTATLVAVGIVAAVLGVNTDEEDATFTALATLAQSAIFIGTAVTFASFTRKPKAWHFGLRRTPLWSAVGWAALGLFVFYLTAAIYSVIVQPDAEQTVAQDLGSNEGTFGLIAAGFLIICVAPAAEEFFFRGFFFKALRSRWSVLGAAAIDGGLFGMIHYDFSGADALLILPPLALLGFIFCLVYEKTGSIFPVIAMHSFNNAIAFGAQADGWQVSLVLGPLMLLAVLTAAHFVPAAPALRGAVARPLRAAGVP
jgi:membrane protease YdiL (CAAX protease family)